MGCFQSISTDKIQTKEIKESSTNTDVEHVEHIEVKNNIYDIYKDCTIENTPEYTFDGLKKIIKVIKIIDGDTVDIALYHEGLGKTFKHRVRLYGIDTPEKRPPKNDPNRDKEIAASKRSSEALYNILKNNDNTVLALFYKSDKYGRLMCTLYDKQGQDINKWMVSNGFAYEYFGKTKQKYEENEDID
jgi:endonuclease YncB( thermonuclease family)